MATHVNAGDSIECSRSEVAVRKISRTIVLINLEKINGESIRLWKYKSNIRAMIKIAVELNPKVCHICETSKLDRDEILEGNVIELYSEKRVSLELTSNFSHVHGIQANTINNFTYAKIVIPWTFVTQRQIAV